MWSKLLGLFQVHKYRKLMLVGAVLVWMICSAIQAFSNAMWACYAPACGLIIMMAITGLMVHSDHMAMLKKFEKDREDLVETLKKEHKE